jgi:putative ABC transport system permease protein
VATEEDRSAGFDLGDTVTVEPGGLALTVVGLASQSQLNVVPTLYTGYDTYVEAVASRNPDAGVPLPNVLALSPQPGTTPQQLADAVNAVDLNLDALTRKQAAAKTPGVDQVRQSFAVIFVLYGLVVPLVTGLFFLIVTFQKANSLTLLRAIGAPSGRLVRSLLVQVSIVLIGGLALGVAGDVGISQGKVGSLQLGICKPTRLASSPEAVAMTSGLRHSSRTKPRCPCLAIGQIAPMLKSGTQTPINTAISSRP